MRLSLWRCLALSSLLGHTSATPASHRGAGANDAATLLTTRQDDAFFQFALNYNSATPGTAVKPGTKMRILCIGDSITVGVGAIDGNSYRARLRDDLSNDQVVYAGTVQGGAMTDNYFAAWSGKTIQYMANNVAAALQQRPNIVLIHAGTNDMNANPAVSTEGNEVGAATERLGALIDQVFSACPDAVVLVAMIIDSCLGDQYLKVDQFQALVPAIVNLRRAAGKHALAANFTSIPTSLFPDCLHPAEQGYHVMGDYWFDFLTQVPKSWITAPVGPDPVRDTSMDKNGGLDGNIPAPDWGPSAVQETTKAAIASAAAGANKPGICRANPLWFSTGKIALGGVGQMGGWQITAGIWQGVGEVASGLGRDPQYVRLVDMDGDGRADYVWLDPVNGMIICWKNNLPFPWTPFGNNGGIIGIGTGVGAAGVQLADLNGDGLADYVVINPDTGAIEVWWNYGPDPGWVNGFKFVAGGQVATGVPHANWKTLRFPDINGDGRADYVYIGVGGSLAHWLNTGSAGGQDVLYLGQGGIASGASPDVDHLVFADIDGDGRDDYLIWDEDAGLTGYLNQRTQREGVPVYIYQGPAKTIASGINRPFREMRLADVDGDGKADYIHVGDNGAISVWYNRNSADTSMRMDGIRFADVDGDGLDDYVWLHPDTGAMTVYLNKGPNQNDVLGWLWSPLYGGQPIATGAGRAATVQLADINGDGRADYLILDPTTGALTVYLNRGPDSAVETGWRFQWIGQVATGLGRGDHVRFGDIDGDGKADYIFLKPNGGTIIYRTTWTSPTQPVWQALPQADASGIGQRPEEISFQDINGDGKADYVWTSPATGRAQVWYNNYPNLPTWLDGGEIASGVGTSGSCIRWANLQRTGRASYVAVDPVTGAIAAWLNGCDDVVPRPLPDIPCNDDPVGRRMPGELVCYGSTEFPNAMSCDECLGKNGHAPATSGANRCVMVKDTQGNFFTVACPGDPAPSTNPDGSPNTIPGALMTSYCQTAKRGLGFDILTWGACLLYGASGNAYEQNKGALTSLCDVFFYGLCTYLKYAGDIPVGE